MLSARMRPTKGDSSRKKKRFTNPLASPFILCLGMGGDLNCKLNFRHVGEENIIGPHIFNPSPPPPAGGELQNRDLLVQLCSRYDLSVMNTFLPKREIQQVTFFDRRIDRWNSDSVDRVFHKQLDVFIVSRTSKHAVLDIRSKRD